MARLPEAQRAALASVTDAGEGGAYGRHPPDDAAFAAALDAAGRWLGPARRRWLRGDAA